MLDETVHYALAMGMFPVTDIYIPERGEYRSSS